MKNAKICLFSLFLLFLGGTLCFPQFVYFPYYGKNKVMYEKFDWKHYKTDHFDIYYYTDEIRDLKTIANLAESAYEMISKDIKHNLSAPVPILFYRTFTDFQQTNLFQIPDGVLGVAEPLLYRIALHGDMAVDETQDLIEHELSHIFEYDLLWGSPGGVLYAISRPPDWVFEGYCEYNTQNWSSWSSLIVRDAVLNDRIPELSSSGQLFSRYPLPRQPAYDFGHAIFDFIEHKYGKNGIREFWHSMKNAPIVGKQNPIKRAFKQSPKEFNYEFKKYLRQKNRDFLLRENPEDYSIPIGPEFPLNPYYFAFSHALSPSGDLVAALLANYKESDFDIIIFSTKDGSVVKNITKGYTLKYEQIKYEIDPSKGKDIAWSPDGDRLAFFGRSGQKHSLFIASVLTGKILKDIPIEQDQPSSPCFYPNGEALLFTAFELGLHDIFQINLSTEKVINLTSNDLFEKAPTISPDGKSVAYSIRLDTYDKLFLSPLNDFKARTQLTFGRGNTFSPEFSQDGKKIYFAGDMRDAYNLYSINLETGKLKRYTDVRTGNFFPIPMPNEENVLIFSSFNKGSFQIFKSEFKGEEVKTVSFADRDDEEKFERFEPILTVSIDEKKIKPYKGIGKLFLTNRPPIDTVISSDGSIYGGSALTFSDLLGDHSFTLMAYQVRSFRSYYFSYLNQKRRLQYMATAFQYTIYYYTPYAYLDPSFYSFYSYRDALATRTISGVNLHAYYPFSKYYRTEASLGFMHYEEEFFDPYFTQQFSAAAGGFSGFWNGNALSATLSLTGETTRFNYYGPVTGNTFRISLTQNLPVKKSFLRSTTVRADYRKYLYLGGHTLFAFRFEGFASRGRNPYIFYFGGNNQVRSAYFYNIIANEGWFANVEFRFPLVNTVSSLIGQIGPIRGVVFFDVARAKIKGYPAEIYSVIDNQLRINDAIGSYGFGFEFFFLGLPIHLEFAKRIEIEDFSKPFDINDFGGFKTKFWIGFDF